MGVYKSRSASSNSISTTLPLKWNARLKHHTVEIRGKSIIRKALYSEFGYLAIGGLACETIETNEHGKYKWTLRVSKLRKAIFVGICQIKQAQQHHFGIYNWGDIGHGHYCIDSEGWVFSHCDDKVNYRQESFKFKEGDVLQFEHDSIMGKFTVTKNYSQRY